MSAKELAEKVRRAKTHVFPISTGSQMRDLMEAIATDIELLIPAYRQPRPEDDWKYCYLEELPSDAPPTLVRIQPDITDYDPIYEFWTVAGWRELTKGIWPCERPE